jgi:hypothetical protein
LRSDPLRLTEDGRHIGRHVAVLEKLDALIKEWLGMLLP